MIVAERKPFEVIKKSVEGYRRLLVVGCGTCVAVCMAGGEKEVGILASELRIAARINGAEVDVRELTLERVCEKEFVALLEEQIYQVDAVLCLACGIGVQLVAEMFPTVPVYPAVNTKFLGVPDEQGVWSERCAACGDCVLDKTGGICPIARCSKSLLNGPCGGSMNGRCEIDPEVPCGWQLIYDRLKALGKLAQLEEFIPPKDWSTARDGGPRKIVREDMRL
ncbi:MAG: methylenetetrahydrofolate reductase C-terminal domain-containing protein [Clostridia bacterium]|nr:methylenetetrahydrofolate reductase C-terminal domain-containing protein [Clostridia bacterium]